jgi:hypothetical protein
MTCKEKWNTGYDPLKSGTLNKIFEKSILSAHFLCIACEQIHLLVRSAIYYVPDMQMSSEFIERDLKF